MLNKVCWLTHLILCISTTVHATTLTPYQANIQTIQEQTQLPIINTLELPQTCFTQGFTIDQQKLYLSCGQYGKSRLSIYTLPAHLSSTKKNQPALKLLQSIPLPPEIFAEGLAVTEDFIYLLTWKSEQLIRFDKHKPSLDTANLFSYSGEGWGLSYDRSQQQLLLSNGRHYIYTFHANAQSLYPNIVSYAPLNAILSLTEKPLEKINELEVVENKLLFNRWFDNTVYFIELLKLQGETPAYANAINLSALSQRHQSTDVLNGIAYNPIDKTIWLTGKNWGMAYQMNAKPFFHLSRSEAPSTLAQ